MNCIIILDTTTVYHYTDRDSAKKILETGYIKQSDPTGPNRDAIAGPGVYVTKMAPGKRSISTVATNNYDDGKSLPRQKMNEGKLDVAIKLEVPKSSVIKAVPDRDVHRHPGNISTKNITDVQVRQKDGSYVSAVKRK